MRLILKTTIISLLFILAMLVPIGNIKAVDQEKEYLNKGTAYINNSEYEKAIESLTEAIQLNPKSDAAYNNRGLAYYKGGDPANAISDFNISLELNPKCAQAYHNRGAVYYKIGSMDKAINDFSTAIQVDPSYANAYNSRAIAFFYKKEYAKSRDDVIHAQRLGYNVHPGFLEALEQAEASNKK